MYFSSATCFDLRVGYHQAIQIVFNIKGMHKIVLSELKSHFYNVFRVAVCNIDIVSTQAKWAIHYAISSYVAFKEVL
jgi:hypothetical protein